MTEPISSNLVSIITGASSGIGAATARLLASKGYKVVLAARRIDLLDELAEEIKSLGGDSLVVKTDITQLDQVENLITQTMTHYGQIDILVNNAGLGRINWLDELDPHDDVEYQIQVNLSGLIQMTRAVLPQMIDRQKGHIINIGSIAGLIATPTYSVYAATKYGLRGFTEALRREVSIQGIEVTGIYPGGVATEFSEKARIKRKTKVSTPGFLRLSAESVAQTILKVIIKPKRAVIIPWLMRPLVWLSVVFPGLVDIIIKNLFTRQER